MESKICKSCGLEKSLESFYFRKENNAHRATCKACFDSKKAAWRAAHPDQTRVYALRSVTKYQRNNREKYLAYKRGYEAKRRANPTIQLSRRISTAMRDALRGSKNRQSWRKITGYELDELKTHLERQFTKGMRWENMGEWHIDHITPLSSFTFAGPDDPEVARAWALPNLRPLWAAENIKKKTKRTHLI